MQKHCLDFSKIRLFTPLFLDYLGQKKELKSFYGLFPKPENFQKQIDFKADNFSKESRAVLVKALKAQYAEIKLSGQVADNIECLADSKTFTVTTGHQLNIFTGPLYTFYKIITVIKACQELTVAYPKKKFVPVYWMATEDHDLAEINHLYFSGSKISWDTDQEGAVGRMHPVGLDAIGKQVGKAGAVFSEAYKSSANLAEAVRKYFHEIFEPYGLVILDGDDQTLKARFKTVMEEDVFRHTPNDLVNASCSDLEGLGYKTQIFPRKVNFFYLDEGVRCRIEADQNGFTGVGTSLKWTKEEMQALINNNPEKLSPNVVLRPLYQEMVLPNLAYVGGPAEVAYWLQLKPVFDHFSITFPMVMPRNHVLWVSGNARRKLEKAGLNTEQYFESPDNLIRDLIEESEGEALRLDSQKTEVRKIFEVIKTQAVSQDKTLEKMVLAEQQRALNSLEKIEKKMMQAAKRNKKDQARQIRSGLEALFPEGTPQERRINILDLGVDPWLFTAQVIAQIEPFDYRFHILVDNE